MRLAGGETAVAMSVRNVSEPSSRYAAGVTFHSLRRMADERLAKRGNIGNLIRTHYLSGIGSSWIARGNSF